MKHLQLKLALTAMLLSFALTSASAYDFEVDGLYYNILEDGFSVEVTNSKSKLSSYSSDNSTYKGDIVVPAEVVYDGLSYNVTKVAQSAFSYNQSINSFVLPEGVVEIEKYAFTGSKSLKSVIFPTTLKTIGLEAFYNCENLEAINIPHGVTSLSASFGNCKKISEVVIPNTVTSISSKDAASTVGTFAGCTSLKKVIFEDGNRPLTINEITNYSSTNVSYTFYGCSIDSIYIGRTIIGKGIGFAKSVLKNNTLKSVKFGKNVISAKNISISDCSELTEICFPDNITELGSIYDNENLRTIYIGKGVKKGFSGSVGLTDLYVGQNVEGIINLGTNQTKQLNLYIFSEKITNIVASKQYARIFVPNPSMYKTILADYDVNYLIESDQSTNEYTGMVPSLSFKNNVPYVELSYDTTALNKGVGTYTDSVNVTFTHGDWSSSIGITYDHSITKAPLTIYADSKQRFYNEEKPELSCSYVGFKNGETSDVLEVQPTLFTTANVDSYVGNYPIYCSEAVGNNYDIAYQSGTLSILKAPQTIMWEQDFTNISVGDEIELTATVSSGLNVKYRSSDQSSVIIASKNGKQYAYILKAGIVAITAYQSGDTNYEEADEITKIVNISTTGIEEIKRQATSYSIYDLKGRRLSKPQKGINIINGKKILVNN